MPHPQKSLAVCPLSIRTTPLNSVSGEDRVLNNGQGRLPEHHPDNHQPRMLANTHMATGREKTLGMHALWKGPEKIMGLHNPELADTAHNSFQIGIMT